MYLKPGSKLRDRLVFPQVLDNTDVSASHTHICAADVQDHEAELKVLRLVQLMDQLSVVSLSQNTRVKSKSIKKLL